MRMEQPARIAGARVKPPKLVGIRNGIKRIGQRLRTEVEGKSAEEQKKSRNQTEDSKAV